MEARDLMIGDWVYNCISDMKFQVYPQFFSQWYNRLEQFAAIIKSISLTPEILEKNEFEKALDESNTECYRYYRSAADGYIKITLWDGGDGVWSLEVVNYEKFDDNEIVYKNNFTFLKVHQLQHVLRLCNIDKEIVL